jgi:alpha/beta superfamily hydrolase
LVLIGFPVASDLLHDEALEGLRAFAKPVLVVVGDGDDFAPLDLLRETLDGVGIEYKLSVIRQTGHFFEGRQREVGEVVAAFIADSLA